jgi:O-antigen/teichoic acid export membrane protein
MDLRKGTVFLILAWAVVLVTGYGLTLVLARRLAFDSYGDYGLVMSILVWLEIVVINGLPVAVQKFTAAHPKQAYGILKSGAGIQAGAAAALYVAAYFGSPLLAGLFQDDHLTFYFRIAFLNIFLYGFLHLLASFQNGLGRFGRQAVILMVFAFGKLGCVILFLSLGHDLVWAFWGNAAGAALGIAAGAAFIRRAPKATAFETGPLVRFALPSVLYSLAVTLLLSIDLWFVNRLLGKGAGAVYVASSQIARIPYFLVFGLSATVLSAVSAAAAAGRMQKVRGTIAQAVRFLCMLAAPIAILATAYRREGMALLFPPRFAPGEAVLGILIWGMVFLAFLVVLTTAINAGGRPVVSFALTSVVVALDAALNAALVPRMGIAGGALATTAAAGAGALASGLIVRRSTGFAMGLKPLLRIALASLVPAAFGLFVPAHGPGLVVVCLLATALYGLVLMALGEIKKEELTGFFRSRPKPDGTPVESVLP